MTADHDAARRPVRRLTAFAARVHTSAMPSHRRLRRFRRTAAALLAAACVAGCADDAYRSSCDSPIAAAYTAYCNPYRQSGGIDG